MVHEYLGSERPVSFEYRLLRDLVYEEAMCEGSSDNLTTLRSESSTLKGLLYALIEQEQYHKDYSTQVEDPAANVARNVALAPWSVVWVRNLLSDKRQSTFIHEFGILWWFPTWAVLRSLANARKCQLEDFCEKKWETHAFCTGNMGAHVRSTYAKKLVSSNLAKILEVATKIRETCELFTPSSPVKATQLYRFCLSDKRSPKLPINI